MPELDLVPELQKITVISKRKQEVQFSKNLSAT